MRVAVAGFVVCDTLFVFEGQFRYLLLAAANGKRDPFLDAMMHLRNHPQQVLLYALGKELCLNPSIANRAREDLVSDANLSIKSHSNSFHQPVKFNEFCSNALQFFLHQSEETKKSIMAWSIVGKHFGVVKDVRILIGKLIWEDRVNTKYAAK